MSQPSLPPLTVNARAPFHVYYEGEAVRVSAANSVGPFDILTGHADFFSIISPCIATVETATDVVSFDITNGIIAVHNNTVALFVNI